MIHQGRRFRIKPNAEQRAALAVHFGCARWVYNHFLDEKGRLYKEAGQNLNYRAAAAALTQLKRQAETAWLADADSQVLQQSLMNLFTAYDNFFEQRARYPVHKRRRGKQSIRYPQRFKLSDDGLRIRLPKVPGWVRVIVHQPIVGRIKSVTVTLTPSGRYYASLCCEAEGQPPRPPQRVDASRITGVDLGIAHLLVTDDGRKFPNPKPLEKSLKKLRRLQKQLSRATMGSKRRGKLRQRIARLHERVANQRRDYIHKLTTHLVDESQAICVEGLRVANMLRNNRRLARHLSDSAFREAVRQFEYKCAMRGRHFVKADPWFPSTKTCSACSARAGKMPLSVRAWTCGVCGAEHDRDINAGVNLKVYGARELSAAGVTVVTRGGA